MISFQNLANMFLSDGFFYGENIFQIAWRKDNLYSLKLCETFFGTPDTYLYLFFLSQTKNFILKKWDWLKRMDLNHITLVSSVSQTDFFIDCNSFIVIKVIKFLFEDVVEARWI